MKKSLMILCCVMCLALLNFGAADAQTTSFEGSSEGFVMVTSETEYLTVTTKDGVTQEIRTVNKYDIDGTITQFYVSKDLSNGYVSETDIQVIGSLYALEKVGKTSTAVIENGPDPGVVQDMMTHHQVDNPSVYFVQWDAAAGVYVNLDGQIIYGSDFSTVDGLNMVNIVDFVGQGIWMMGAAQNSKELIIPPSGSIDEIIAQSIQRYEDHVKIVGYSPDGSPIMFYGIYRVDMKPIP